jgi:protein-S-isoprenylcysteine O-methyltransferase Ste14
VFAVVRALTYAALFVGFFLVYLPARVLERAGVAAPPELGAAQVAGIIITTSGAALALTCVLTFAIVGRGTPAPFDPPRRLVARGPYAWVRNPMYIGAWLALAGAALYFWSGALLLFAAGFAVATVVFVRFYEEPTLRRLFGPEYERYCARVGRWWPGRAAGPL